MRKLPLLIVFSCFLVASFAQKHDSTESIKLLFIGDVMGHDAQIESAYDSITNTYNYNGVFEKVSPIIKQADFAIANLEVTLAGKPYRGYPAFSSPDELAVACKNNGINVFITANNHSVDRGKKGILRTIYALDSLKIPHTGTFINSTERAKSNLLILDKNNIKVGILNYTYGTNGIKIPSPTVVNLIDTTQMLVDIKKSKKDSLDKLIVTVHWGKEYMLHPSKEQVKIANFLFNNGVDIVIGSHPHVLQRMEYFTKKNKEHLITYSLGNYVSNQRTRNRDGGAMAEFTLTKINGEVKISNKGYYLTWVHKYMANGKWIYNILPCAKYEAAKFKGMDEFSINKMKVFISDSRTLLDKENVSMPEIK